MHYEITDTDRDASALRGMFPMLTLYSSHIVIVTPALVHLSRDPRRARALRARLEEWGSRGHRPRRPPRTCCLTGPDTTEQPARP